MDDGRPPPGHPDEIIWLRGYEAGVVQMREDAAAMTDPRDEALRACVEALEEARDDLIAWGAYASDYFKDKHDFDGDVARLDAALATTRAALEAPTRRTDNGS